MPLQNYLEKLALKNIQSIEKIVHENSLSSSIYLITQNAQKYILKIPYNEIRYFREVYFLNFLKDKIKIPKIIKTIEPEEKLSGAILMEYIDGDILNAKTLTKTQAFQMGELLACVHNIPCKYFGDVAKNELNSTNNLTFQKILKDDFFESLEECQNVLPDDFLKKIELFFSDQIEHLPNLDGPKITHRDFKPGNIIYKNGKIEALIDFEISKFNFAEEDFAQIEYLVWDNFPNTKKDFLDGYKSIRKLPDFDKILPLLRVIKALGAIGFTVVRNTYKNEHKFVFDKNLEFLKNKIC